MITASNATGDGITSVKIVTSIELDTSNTVLISGTVLDPAVGVLQSITGSPVTIPAAPGSGSVYYIIQVNTSTGAATVKQSTVAIPAPDPGNALVFQQTRPSTAPDASLTMFATPDTW